ncbi:putative dienelactone hydrolase [Paenibacillus castaneae]|uniref:alpha/beta hydrolase family protein n=1 Tax=Paenibacillus castaneae TaxID=474957 RepID=UPI00141B9E8F|nr:hypothetical protein [Paenibacillus castaneae]NIK77244.1 putative dienelactone hydrolase [Paenibacillus castaneae]
MRIGRVTREMTDTSRDNPFNQDGSKRRFMISMYYPADHEQDFTHELMYPELFHPGEDVALAFFRNIGADISYLSSLKTNVFHNVSASKQGAFPVIVFSPAFGIERDMYWFTISNLVANGFIVVTVGATYDSVFTVFHDGESIEQSKTLADLEGTDMNGWESLLEIRVDDVRYILHKLPEINEKDLALRGEFDLQRLALIGHSLGGAAVYRIAQTESNIKACILLDPSLHLLGSFTTSLSIPFLLLRQNSSTYEMLMEDGWNAAVAHETMVGQSKLASVLSGYKSFMKIHGANHVTFSDAPIHFNEPEIAEKHHIINELTAAFFKQFVCGQFGEYSNTIGQRTGCSQIDHAGHAIPND